MITLAALTALSASSVPYRQWIIGSSQLSRTMLPLLLLMSSCLSVQAATPDRQPPKITTQPHSGLSFDSVTITWKTDEPATSQVLWGITPAYENASPQSPALVTEHRVVLTGLQPATTYHYQLKSKDAAGNEAVHPVDASFTTTIDPNAPFAFALRASGPRHVSRGHNLYIGLYSKLVAGKARNIDISVEKTSSPNFASSFLQGYGTAKKTATIWNTGGDATLAINTANTPPGSYTLELLANAGEGVTQRVVIPFTVTPLLTEPVTAQRTLMRRAPAGTIPDLAQWEEQMITKGKRHCGPNLEQAGLWEGNVWYYDGTRVYQQIADYTGDPSWLDCAARVTKLYRDTYLLPNKGGLPGWRIFSHGLREDYLRTGDPLAREAVQLLAANAAGANPVTPLAWSIPSESSREVAYRIEAFLDSEAVSGQAPPQLSTMVDLALGHLDQWFVSRNTEYVRPFMFALTAEALIEYEKRTGDPRIMPAVQAGADAIWEWWDAEKQGFRYTNVNHFEGGTGAAPDLNLLIAPIYAWLYQRTGEPRHLMRGKHVFSGGVKHAWLDGGKPFSQNYRWSFEFVRILKLLASDPATDRTTPVITGGLEGGKAFTPAWTRGLTVATNEFAEVRYALAPGIAYEKMPHRFNTTTGRLHRALLPAPETGQQISTCYVKARDGAGNVTPKDYVINISPKG